jgi:hypothetical protein
MTNELDVIPEPEGASGLSRVMVEGDPDVLLAVMEKKAALAGRMRGAIETMVVSQTYPQDWTIQGEGDKAKACLSSAGAERVGRNFPIRFERIEWKKETWSDAMGSAYRYLYTGYAILYDQTVYAEGTYSTRDEFLGKAKGEWRPLEDINEGDIRSAAHHIFCGNAIKELLGLRGMPDSEYHRIMGGTGRSPAKSTSVQRGQGTQGGTGDDDVRHQKELAELCIGFANNAQTVQHDEEGNWSLCPLSESDSREMMDIAKEICVLLSSFRADDGKTVRGKGAKELKGKS